MHIDHIRMTEVAEQIDGRPEGALVGARVLHAELSSRRAPDPQLLGWTRFYELKALHTLQRWTEALAVLDRVEAHPTVVSRRNAAWMHSVAADCALHAGRPERIPSLMVRALRLRVADGDGDCAAMAIGTALALAEAAGDPELAARFVEEALGPDVEGLASPERVALAVAGTASQTWFLDALPVRYRSRRDLWEASRDGDLDAVRRHLAGGVDPEARLPRMPGLPTPLIVAAFEGRPGVVAALLDAGVQVDEGNVQGRTALHLAADQGHVACVDLLVRAGADLEVVDLHQQTALHLASWQDHRSTVARLLVAGASVQARDVNGDTPLGVAATEPVAQVVRALLSAGSDLESRNDHDQTALHRACMEGQAEIAVVLLDAGADAAVQDRNGLTPAAWARHEGHDALARMLGSR